MAADYLHFTAILHTSLLPGDRMVAGPFRRRSARLVHWHACEGSVCYVHSTTCPPEDVAGVSHIGKSGRVWREIESDTGQRYLDVIFQDGVRLECLLEDLVTLTIPCIVQRSHTTPNRKRYLAS